ncbi:hypothetical protein GCM10029978_088480 [Actinoallomurus acanthiterrae]
MWPVQNRRKSPSRHRLGGVGSEAVTGGLARAGTGARREMRTAQRVLESLRAGPGPRNPGRGRCAVPQFGYGTR